MSYESQFGGPSGNRGARSRFAALWPRSPSCPASGFALLVLHCLCDRSARLARRFKRRGPIVRRHGNDRGNAPASPREPKLAHRNQSRARTPPPGCRPGSALRLRTAKGRSAADGDVACGRTCHAEADESSPEPAPLPSELIALQTKIRRVLAPTFRSTKTPATTTLGR